MKIKTGKSHRYGQTCNTSIGEVKFDKDGVAEIKDGDFEKLKLVMRDIEKVGKSDDKKKEADKGSDKGKDDGADKGSGTDDSKSEEEVRDELKVLKLVDLKEMASKIDGVDVDAVEAMKAKAPVIDMIVAEMFKDK